MVSLRGPVQRFVEAQGGSYAQATARPGMLLPPARTFAGIYNVMSRMYSSRWDEAIRAGRENARAMRRDAFLKSLEQERITPLRRWQWTLEQVRDTQAVRKSDSDADADNIRAMLETCMRRIARPNQLRGYLGQAIWYGRYGSQTVWDWGTVAGQRIWMPVQHHPIHGDKIHHDFDGTPGVMINPAFRDQYPDVRTFDGLGPVMLLKQERHRQAFIVHTHDVEDADFLEPEAIGRTQGVGLRDYLYWAWWLRDEMISWLVDYMEKVGNLGILIFYYTAGNAKSEAAAVKAASEVSTRAALAAPIPEGMSSATSRVENIPANTAGAQFLTDLIGNWFERHIERLWVGQSMSAGADNESGLGGSGRAELSADTKFQLLASDAENLEETLTADWVKPVQQVNRLGWGRYQFRVKFILPDPNANDRMDLILKGISAGVEVPEDEVREIMRTRRPEPGEKTLGGTPQANGQPGARPQDPSQQATVPAEAEAEITRLAAAGDWAEAERIATQYEWTPSTSKTGGPKAIWSGAGKRDPLYGSEAEAALAGTDPAAGKDNPRRPAASNEQPQPSPGRTLLEKLRALSPEQLRQKAASLGSAASGRAVAAGGAVGERVTQVREFSQRQLEDAETALSTTRGGRAIVRAGKSARGIFRAGHHAMFAAMHASQEVAVEAAKERGLPPEKVEALKRNLAIGDFVGGYAAGAAGSVVGGAVGAKVGSLFPTVSVFYLAYSTARKPVATWRAAKKVAIHTAEKLREVDPVATAREAVRTATGYAADHQPPALARELAAILADGDTEEVTAIWYACVAQAGGDLDYALRLISAARAAETGV